MPKKNETRRSERPQRVTRTPRRLVSETDTTDTTDTSDASDASDIETVYSNTPPLNAGRKKRLNTSLREEATDEDTRSNKSLPPEAKAMMAEWMYRHADDPYPSAEKVAEFVHRGGIEKCQVKQYLINFRRRQLPKAKKKVVDQSKTTVKRSKIAVSSKEKQPAATSLIKATPAAASLIKTTPAAASLIKTTPAAASLIKTTPAAASLIKTTPAAASLIKATPAAASLIKATPAAASLIKTTPAATSLIKTTPAAASLIKTTPAAASLIKADAQAAKKEAIELAMAETAKAAALATIGDFTDPSKKNYSFGLSISTMTWMARVQDMVENGSS